mmetsp:Transcript_1243/g.3841  ORF Transcript_1243/g.3841 Transcript_1243/m.3841 type:complete len:347 (+) Transcript_1243:87-1127(+)
MAFVNFALHAGAASKVCKFGEAPARGRCPQRSNVRAMAEEEGRKWDLVLASPAKINLFLRILRRREDGYHDLASVFQAISLRDTLFISRLGADAERDEFECDAPGVPSDENNLVLRALNVFRLRTGETQKFRVRLEKKIPVQAGLGGGSSNAATALYGANALCNKPASSTELADFGAEIGSDISFFFSNGTAYCTGRGEIFESMKRLPPTSLYIIKPKEGLSTGAVFRALDLNKTSDKAPEELRKQIESRMIYNLDFVNDLERPSFELSKRLADIKTACREAGFKAVLMSGSGTAFFCLGEPAREFVDAFEPRMKVLFDVDIYNCFFISRPDPDLWYLQEREKPLR